MSRVISRWSEMVRSAGQVADDGAREADRRGREIYAWGDMERV